MRSRLLLAGAAVAAALSFVPQASAEPVNCHHIPDICATIDRLFHS
ncbi:MAG TPA: hypothetical protein VGX28_09940 [Frankiaceae bacterium]|jgi:hypothetical protein|nr:hypothetical protein [Frankiaceae bacterium]